MIDWLLALGFMALVFAAIALPGFLKRRRSGYGSAYTKEQIAEFEAQKEAWEEEYKRKNPEGPPITEEEHAAFRAWLDEQERPAVRFHPAKEPGGAEPDGSRIGGPVWLAEGEHWPHSKGGKRMEFICQIDFAQMPALEGFPKQGVLQFFLPVDDDMWGMNLDDPFQTDIAILHRASGAGTQRFEPVSPDPMDDLSALTDRTRMEGVVLHPDSYTARIPWEHWRVAKQSEGKGRREGIELWDDMLIDEADKAPLAHHTGGYPIFVQSDPRREFSLQDYDTCLLNLTSDDHLTWGDVGEANFLIRQEDLEKSDFSRVIFWWDCS